MSARREPEAGRTPAWAQARRLTGRRTPERVGGPSGSGRGWLDPAVWRRWLRTPTGSFTLAAGLFCGGLAIALGTGRAPEPLPPPPVAPCPSGPEATEVCVARLAGVVEESLLDDVVARGEAPELVAAFAEVFAWDFDFASQSRAGDTFAMLYEKRYEGGGFAGYGRVLAGHYQTGEQRRLALYFEDQTGHGDYYGPGGLSVRRHFLRAPLEYTRISSRYTRSRLHPILGIWRPHYGVDYAAPTGTPVWAVADGEIVFRGWKGGFGRLVELRHRDGYVSFYGHLSGFAAGQRTGQQVSQKDVIGYVGSTGLSTGPHLDYRLQRHGRFVDPLQVRLAEGRPIPRTERWRFEVQKAERLARLDALPVPGDVAQQPPGEGERGERSTAEARQAAPELSADQPSGAEQGGGDS